MPESSNKGGRKPRVTDENLLDVFRSTPDPVLSTAEVAEQVPIKRRGTLNRLQSLEEDGDLESKQIGGRNTVWWLVAEQGVSDTGRRPPASEGVSFDEAAETDPVDDGEEAGMNVDRLAQEALVADVVERVADGWDDSPDRLAARKAAARAVLAYAVESGEHVGKSDAVERFYDEHPVEEQNEDTWWRKNIRNDILSELGEYSQGNGGYRVTADDLAAFVEEQR